MEKVSTRQRGSATSVTSNATAVVADATSVAEREAEHAAILKLAEIFDEAARTDEPHQYSGESDRLLRVAADMARLFVARHTSETDIQNFAFDLSALVRASRLVPGDTESLERLNLLKQAEPILAHLAEAETDMIEPAAKRAALADRQVTPDTLIQDAGRHGEEVVCRCTYDIEGLSEAILTMADEYQMPGPCGPLLRAYGDRINRLNSVVMSYLNDDSLTLRRGFDVVWNGSRSIEGALL